MRGHWGGRYPLITRSLSLEARPTTAPEISRVAAQLLSKVGGKEKIGSRDSRCINSSARYHQLGLFDVGTGGGCEAATLNRALDSLAKRFGDEAVTRGLARAERATPTRRIK